MIGGKRVIGVCVTKIHERSRAEFVQKLFKAAQKSDTKVMVFNSVLDFYKDKDYDSGAKAIYSLINYDIVDAIVIFSRHFYSKEIFDGIVSGAHERNIPVIVVDEVVEGCYSIIKDYTAAYKQVIDHVITEHGVTDSFYISGIKDDPQSEERIDCYREVLESHGLPFSREQVDYGEFWDIPTQVVMNKLLSDGKKPPRAIFCANDSMAITVCEYLRKAGYTVPEDVIVTGFDGMPDARYYNPRLTTCLEDVDQLVDLCVELVDGALNGTHSVGVYKETYTPLIACSCGCNVADTSVTKDALELYNVMQNSNSHEMYMYTWIDRMIDCKDIDSLREYTHHCILACSCMCVKSDVIISSDYLNGRLSVDKSDTMYAIPSHKYDDGIVMLQPFPYTDMAPDLSRWADEDKIYVFTSVYAGNEPCGYYAVKTDELDVTCHQINRLCKILNISFNSTLKTVRQNALRRKIENAALINQYTGLPNLKGLSRWFEDFSSVPENHERPLSVSIYGLPNYRFIYENHGIRDVEEALQHIAGMLLRANPKNCMVAHISQDEFIVVNYYNDANEIGDTINAATSAYFTEQAAYNESSGKDYYVEVNCGCTVINPGWNDPLATYISLASGEMYVNRVKMGIVEVEKEKKAPVENYDAFRTLIDKNLFNYHFQPIVEAKTGEIYAYEALMRTDKSIGMNPLEVLEIAQAYKRLYDVERATVFNVMERYAKENDKFCGRKVFINSIPGNILTADDDQELCERYGSFMNNVVFEITEQNSVSDDELAAIKNVGNVLGTNDIAIDDYGTGHSNIVNLLRYQPQIIKIDRFLITDVDKDVNKQMFLRSTIDFARMNNIKVLAEGVETSEELRTVIDFGVDYVQGYYTGRPAPEPIAEIAPEIRKEFIR